MKSATHRRFVTVHTWAGLLAGMALFVAFYAGALSVFHHQIEVWQTPAWRAQPLHGLDQADRLIKAVIARHPGAGASIGLTVPGEDYRDLGAYWVADGGYQHASARTVFGTPAAAAAGPGKGSDLADLVYSLHYSLGIPVIGLYLMGVVSVIYGLALLTGVLIHLRHLVPDLFALRAGRNIKRLWQDAHNVIGVLSLPFHVIFAVTGALLCLSTLMVALFNTLAFDGRLGPAYVQATFGSPVVAKAGRGEAMLPVPDLVRRAQAVARARGVVDFQPDYIGFSNYGDANAVVDVRGIAQRTIGNLGHVALNAATGKVLAVHLPGSRDANHATYSAIFALHFGSFGGQTVRWLYFVLGLAGAFLFYSGNLLWVESRRKRRSIEQPRRVRGMARFTVAACIGSCLAISASFVATLLAPYLVDDVGAAEKWVCFVTFAAACAWTTWRPPSRAAVELLVATAVVTIAVPLLDMSLHARQWWALLAQGAWTVPAVDLTAAAMALVFGALAWRTQRRATSGDPCSVWHHPARPRARVAQDTEPA